MQACPAANDYGNCQFDIVPVEDSTIPLDAPVLLGAADADLAVQSDGSAENAAERLGTCADTDDPTCRWIFEPSTTRYGAYYVRREGTDLFLHAKGGASAGNVITLHSCDAAQDCANCQWFVEASTTRDGAWYLRSTGADLYLHSSYGSTLGAEQALHACPEANDHGNCQRNILPTDDSEVASPQQDTGWSDWINRDDPSGTADNEGFVEAFQAGLLDCDDPVAVQARRISDGVDATQTGEVITLDLETGFTCIRAEQPDGSCDDYEVRYACPILNDIIVRDANVAGAWGQNDQYGFTVDLPIIPVAVSAYVKGEDAEWVANEIADSSIQAYDDVSAFAAHAWNVTSDWAENAGSDMVAGVKNEYEDSKAAVVKFGNQALAFAESEGSTYISEIGDFFNDAGSVFDGIGDGFVSGFNTTINAIDEFFSFSWL